MSNKQVAPRRTRRKRGKTVSPQQLLSGTDQIVTINGKTFLFITATSGVANLNLNPAQTGTGMSSLGGRLSALASCFEEFRFTRLVFKLSPVPTSFTSGYTIGYTKVVPNSSPTTAEGIYQADASRYMGAATTNPQMMTVPRRVLTSGLRTWYKCIYNSGEDDAEDCFQGVFFSSNAGTSGGFTIECGYTIQFRGNDDPTST